MRELGQHPATIAKRQRLRTESPTLCQGTVALCHPYARSGHDHSNARWSNGDCPVVEGDAEPVAAGGVSGDVVLAAARVLDEGMTGGENPR
jgi:hypothetical protein